MQPAVCRTSLRTPATTAAARHHADTCPALSRFFLLSSSRSSPRPTSTGPYRTQPFVIRKEPLLATGTTNQRGMLTLADLCAELQISRSTFYDWRAKGRAPRCLKLPNGDLRIRRTDLDRWLSRLEAA